MLWERGAAREQEIMGSGSVADLDLSGYYGDEKERLTHAETGGTAMGAARRRPLVGVRSV